MLLTGQREPPVTATPAPEDELTPFDAPRLPAVLDELAEDVEFDACVVDEEEVPGMVAALTTLKTPTPVTDATAAPAVNR